MASAGLWWSGEYPRSNHQTDKRLIAVALFQKDFPGRVLPHELGAAAGYEAFQQWAMYGGVYRSALRGEKEREKEALAGIAVGEAAKLAAAITPGQ